MSRSTFAIAADHPCLDGHFPGDPVVPGVVILERVIDAVQAHGGPGVAGIRRCKFVRILRPGERCVVEWRAPDDDAHGGVRFVCTGARGLLAQGMLTLRAAGDG